MTTEDYLVAITGVHTAAIVGIAVYVIRTREVVTRLQEWARWIEKRVNGTTPPR